MEYGCDMIAIIVVWTEVIAIQHSFIYLFYCRKRTYKDIQK